jgi:hypothetical protein
MLEDLQLLQLNQLAQYRAMRGSTQTLQKLTFTLAEHL